MQKSQAKFLALIILSSLSSCSITPSNNTPITSQTNTGTLYVTGVPMTIATGGVQVNNNTLHSDIIFQKELAPGIEVRQTEKKTSLFYKNKVIDSRDNTLH